MPFLCIFSDFSDSIPLKVRLSTTLILFRFISLKRQEEAPGHPQIPAPCPAIHECGAGTRHSQELELGQFEHFRRQHGESVSVQLQHQQRAGDVFKAARLQDTDLVVTQISLRKEKKSRRMVKKKHWLCYDIWRLEECTKQIFTKKIKLNYDFILKCWAPFLNRFSYWFLQRFKQKFGEEKLRWTTFESNCLQILQLHEWERSSFELRDGIWC